MSIQQSIRRFAPRALLLLIFFVFATHDVNAANNSQLRVYRPDGSLLCGMGQERSLADDQAVLEKLGAKVISAEKKILPFRISFVCGSPTGRVNTYVISEADWNSVRRGFVGPVGFGRWIFDTPTVVVYKYDGTLQCKGGKEISLDEMAKQLNDGGIRILSPPKKATDGLLHMQLCYSSTGNVNTYEISSADLQKAIDLGFAYFVSPQTAKMILDAGIQPQMLTPNADGLPLPWPFPW